MSKHEIFVEALSLPARARAELAHKLLAALEKASTSSEVEEAWKAEALDRCAAYDAGQLTERDAADVLRDAYGKAK